MNRELSDAKRRLDDYVESCRAKGLPVNPVVVGIHKAAIKMLQSEVDDGYSS